MLLNRVADSTVEWSFDPLLSKTANVWNRTKINKKINMDKHDSPGL